jgi:hypothetical protein
MQSPTALSYQETLRTIGGVLDAAGGTIAVLALSPAGLRVNANVATVSSPTHRCRLGGASVRLGAPARG